MMANLSSAMGAQFAETVRQLTGGKSEIVYRPLPVDDPKVRRPDISNARRVLGWEPEVSFEKMVALMVEADLQRHRHFQEHPPYVPAE